MFKSYYVVWKPNEIPYSSSPSALFKSYYVVWKPTNIDMSRKNI